MFSVDSQQSIKACTVHAVHNALQLTNHILKWCFRVSTGCPVVFSILEEENTGPYLDRRFTSLVCIWLWLLLLSCSYNYWECCQYPTYQLSKSGLLCKMQNKTTSRKQWSGCSMIQHRILEWWWKFNFQKEKKKKRIFYIFVFLKKILLNVLLRLVWFTVVVFLEI